MLKRLLSAQAIVKKPKVPQMEFCAVFVDNDAQSTLNARFNDGWVPRDYASTYCVGTLIILEREKRG